MIPQSAIFFLITLSLSIFIAPYTKELSKELISIDTIDEQIESIKPKNIFPFMESDGFIYAQDKNGSTLENVVIFLEDEDLLEKWMECDWKRVAIVIPIAQTKYHNS